MGCAGCRSVRRVAKAQRTRSDRPRRARVLSAYADRTVLSAVGRDVRIPAGSSQVTVSYHLQGSAQGRTETVGSGADRGERFGEGLLNRRGADAEFACDLAAVHYERLLELVLHLQEFAHGRVDEGNGAQQRQWHGAEFGPALARVWVDDVDELPRGAGGGVVG